MTDITIVYEDGSETINVDEEHFIEEVDLCDAGRPAIRVWHDDPANDSDAYTDYSLGNIVEVMP